MRHLSLIAMTILCTVAACDPADSTTTEESAAPGDFRVVAVAGSTEVEAVDGAQLPWEWGNQGGTMLRPMLILEGDGWSAGDRFRVRVEHSVDPDAPGAFGEIADFPSLEVGMTVREDGGRLVLGPIDDLLGWNSLDGRRMTLTVSVSGGGVSKQLVRRVGLENPKDDTDPCADIDVHDGSCGYYKLPAIATVQCDDGVPADRVTLEPATDAAALCGQSLKSESPFGDSDIGIEPLPASVCNGGSDPVDVPAVAEVQFRGACTPLLIELMP